MLSTFDDRVHLSTYVDRTKLSSFNDKVVPMRINAMGDVAAAVRGRREELGLSQGDLARRVGVSRAWINAVEAAKARVEFDLVLRLFDELGLQVELVRPDNPGDVLTGRSVDLDAILDEYRDR